MQLLLVIVGIGLIVVGLVLVVVGLGGSKSGGTAGKFALEGPAWLLLVGVGVGMLFFVTAWNWDDNDSPTEESIDPPTPLLPPTPTPEPTQPPNPEPVALDCEQARAQSGPATRVSFQPGAESADLQGRSESGDAHSYVVAVSGSQTINLVSSTETPPLLCVFESTSGELLAQAVSFRASSPVLPRAGDYLIVIGGLDGGTYELAIQIPAL